MPTPGAAEAVRELFHAVETRLRVLETGGRSFELGAFGFEKPDLSSEVSLVDFTVFEIKTPP